MKIIDENSSPEEMRDASAAIIKFAESFSSTPGVAATLITQAVAMYAMHQEEAPGALALQVAFLSQQLATWLDTEAEQRPANDEARR